MQVIKRVPHLHSREWRCAALEGKCIAVIFSHYATAVAEVKMALVFLHLTQKSNTLVTNGNRVVIVQWSNISSNRVKSYNKARNNSTKN